MAIGSDSGDRTVKFTNERLDSALGSVGESLLTVDVLPIPLRDREWWRAYTDFHTFGASMSFRQPQVTGRLGEIGPCANFVLTFPTRIFDPLQETESSQVLLASLREIFAGHHLSYAFINRGQRSRAPDSVGVDDVFYRTASSIPVSAFDYDLRGHVNNLYDTWVRSSFWANFLNSKHLAALGGLSAVRSLPVYRIAPLRNGGALIVLTPSPLDVSSKAMLAYRAFREFIEPLRLETPLEEAAAIGRLKDDSSAVGMR